MKYLLILLLSILLFSCEQKIEKRGLKGNAQGSTFGITYYSDDEISPLAIDSIFKVMDQYFSLWDSNSYLSRFNHSGDTCFTIKQDAHFRKVLEASQEIYTQSHSAFDPSIYPLVKKWGFGKNILDTNINIDSALNLVGFNKIQWQDKSGNTTIVKDYNQNIDFNSIAQGYTVDVICEYLEQQGVNSYMVEVGGELRVGNRKPNGDLWKIGVDKPIKDIKERELMDTLKLENAAVATSGSYRKFYEKNGKKFSHTINPKTGFPVDHNTLSVTVITQPANCMKADAWATTYMVLGSDSLANYQQKNMQVITITDSLGEFVLKRH